MIVSILSLILCSLILFIIAYYCEKGYFRGIALPMTLIVILDNILAYSIALLYYGHDTIEFGLNIYSFIYLPYTYLITKYYREGKSLYSITILLAMILYYFTSTYFYASPLNIFSILIMIYFIRPLEYNKAIKVLYSLPIIFIILTPLSLPMLFYNLQVTLYPYNPSTLNEMQWMQYKIGMYCKGGDVFEYIYDPARLRILDPCVTIKGYVVSNIYKFEDGDIGFDLKPDPEYQYMLSIGSIVFETWTYTR